MLVRYIQRERHVKKMMGEMQRERARKTMRMFCFVLFCVGGTDDGRHHRAREGERGRERRGKKEEGAMPIEGRGAPVGMGWASQQPGLSALSP